ncbi:MAG: transposase [Bacteroidetes bacterium]|nr:transposase [Bacteroidota bacterium]
MSRKYKFRNQELPYFVTLTVVSWIDVFTRDVYREAFINSLKYCQFHKGLIVYAYCIMTNHIHLIIGTTDKPMQYILRDLKSYTSRVIRELISHRDTRESRHRWMVDIFKQAGHKNSNNNEWQFWQQHNHPIELWDSYMVDQKLSYVHNNPVAAGHVLRAEDWRCSSAAAYSGVADSSIELHFL